jgi:RNA methyltransferase, TrmH family
MLSSARIKHIKSLQQKKYRKLNGQFVAEGDKIVSDLLQGSFHIEGIYATPEWMDKHMTFIPPHVFTEQISTSELDRISGLAAPNQVLAVVKMPDLTNKQILPFRGLSLFLDDIQDPGNLGTIIRTADWFGISQVFCSPETADIFNPKVIQASMGSFIRVGIRYLSLDALLKQLPDKPMVYGASLDGANLFHEPLIKPALLVIGNESKGISPDLTPLIDAFLHIPGNRATPLMPRHGGAESLNASVAAAIMMAWFQK